MIKELSNRFFFYPVHSKNEPGIISTFIKIEKTIDIQFYNRIENITGKIYIPMWMIKLIKSDFIFHELKKIIYFELNSRLAKSMVGNAPDLSSILEISRIYITYDIIRGTFDLVYNKISIRHDYVVIIFRVDIIISDSTKIRTLTQLQ